MFLRLATAAHDRPGREFLSTIVLGPHVQQLPEALREPFMDDVLAKLGEPVVVDYVRLNIDAVARKHKDRTYTITVKCTDFSGNASKEKTAIVVSHPKS